MSDFAVGDRVKIKDSNWRAGRTGVVFMAPFTTVYVTLDPEPEDPPRWRGSIGISVEELEYEESP